MSDSSTQDLSLLLERIAKFEQSCQGLGLKRKGKKRNPWKKLHRERDKELFELKLILLELRDTGGELDVLLESLDATRRSRRGEV